MHKRFRAFPVIALLLTLLVVIPLAGCGSGASEGLSSPLYQPIFTPASQKLAETSGQDFTGELYREALAYEPALDDPGTQVSMGYWSAAGNHGSLVRVLDQINATSTAPQKAIWDEGATSSNQYPAYLDMLEEHWYERASPKDGKVTIYGKKYSDVNPVSMDQANDIWGQYSQRYADMARLIKKSTGKPVQAWCFVQGARAGRVFPKYELPELTKLEKSGDVQVFFARTQDANPANAADWVQGTANAPAPLPQ
jgi:hypothetical protein